MPGAGLIAGNSFAVDGVRAWTEQGASFDSRPLRVVAQDEVLLERTSNSLMLSKRALRARRSTHDMGDHRNGTMLPTSNLPPLYVRLAGSPGMKVTIYRGPPQGQTFDLPCLVGFRPGYRYRIELSEVVSALNQHPAVRESVVSTCENDSAEKRLVAYVVPQAALPPISELRDFLAQQLPDYMLPATFVRLDAVPVGASGKVNRSALPAPTEENILREESFESPRTQTEQRVAAMVASLLGLPQVGRNDNFFYLGGNSLFGTQVIARLRDTFHVDLPLLTLFDHPTVVDLAAEVERLMVANLDAMSEDEAQRLLDLNSQQPKL